jgi:tRNA(fMet)-specific endonuclease VapC
VKYLLDANIIIVALSGTNLALRQRMGSCDEDDFVTSAIAFGEVAHGSARGKAPSPKALEQFVSRVPVLPFDADAALVYADIPFKRASYDRLIAAHALSLNLTVVTENVRHFSDVPGLKVENWTA